MRKKQEGKGRSGDGGWKKKEWKYKQTMEFLEAFIDIGRYVKNYLKTVKADLQAL
jgi:hypothetical protein